MASRLRGLIRWLLEKRYNVLARLFGVPLAGQESARPGSVIVQVDALGYQNLLTVLEKGHLPRLKALLQSGEYRLQRWRCGLPSDTPPVQSGILYGYNQDMVGFYWMDKSTGRRLNCANPLHARLMEQEIAAKGRPGVLAQGSCYSTIISGNARKAVFTVSRLDSYQLQNAFGLLGAFLFVLFKPPIFFTTAAHFFWDLVQEITDYLVSRFKGRLRRKEGFFPITRAIINVLFREVATAGAVMDMFCGLPIIYVSYLGYDAVGHHSGPLSRNALRTLKGIDRAIGRIERTLRWCRRPYNLYVISDHGMIPSIPFHLAYGQALSGYIATVVGEGVAVDEYDADRYLGSDQLSPLNRDLEEIERHLPRGVSGLFRRTRTLLYRGDGYRTPMGGGRISVIDCSPIAHIYIHGLPRRLQIEEIERLHPGLIAALVSHPGIGLVLGLDGDGVAILSKDGRRTIGQNPTLQGEDAGSPGRLEGVPQYHTMQGEDAGRPGGLGGVPHNHTMQGEDAGRPGGLGGVPQNHAIQGEDPLKQFEEPELVIEEIRRLALTPLSGDLILFGTFEDGRIISFQSQIGAHGSLGGDQFYPFFIHHRSLDISLDKITTAADMYPIFRQMAGMDDEERRRKKEAPRPKTKGGRLVANK